MRGAFLFLKLGTTSPRVLVTRVSHSMPHSALKARELYSLHRPNDFPTLTISKILNPFHPRVLKIKFKKLHKNPN